MRASVLLSVLGLLALAAGCDKAPTGPSSPAPPAPGAGGQRSTGPIAFVSDRDGTDQIYLANEDGSAVTRLTDGAMPTWSRDGQRLAFYKAREIYVINVNGSGLRRVAGGWEPDWSPDGRLIAFRDPTFSISAIDANGLNGQMLYQSRYGAFAPAWSPDGRRIAFSVGTFVDDGMGLWVMNEDGSDVRNIGPNDAWEPVWSPDGSEIAFMTHAGIGVVHADGSGRRLPVAGQFTDGLDWTPDGRLIFTKSPSGAPNAPSRRIFVSNGGIEQQLIPEAASPAHPTYSDSQATWRR